ncbi:dihydrodipicolinate synthase family protein [Paenibacillus sp. GCM10027626]|uniref:dihydrodipicolinate synthase family protein n=1 Tax=Paenibacillus sp. GCM10027626 TaxID=3273411 RepID=UPI003638D53B
MSHSFYPALGTPLDQEGNLLVNSFVQHIEDQMNHKAEGLLIMGSMGIQPNIKDEQYGKVAEIGVQAVKGQRSVYVGVMDNSIARVQDRIERLRGLRLDGVVATAPFYFASSQGEAQAFYRAIADSSPFPLYLYDLPGVTQCKLQAATVIQLMQHANIAGIKTGDLALARVLYRHVQESDSAFEVIYSGLDTFDAAYQYGITKTLDGMFSCTAETSERMYAALQAGEHELVAQQLDLIIGLRNVFVEVGVFPGFTHAMNLLGFAGNFHPDYCPPLNGQQAERVKQYMQHMKLI